MVPYSVNFGGEYFFFGDLGGMDGFVSLKLEFATESPWTPMLGLNQMLAANCGQTLLFYRNRSTHCRRRPRLSNLGRQRGGLRIGVEANLQGNTVRYAQKSKLFGMATNNPV